MVQKKKKRGDGGLGRPQGWQGEKTGLGTLLDITQGEGGIEWLRIGGIAIGIGGRRKSPQRAVKNLQI